MGRPRSQTGASPRPGLLTHVHAPSCPGHLSMSGPPHVRGISPRLGLFASGLADVGVVWSSQAPDSISLGFPEC